MSPPLQTAAVVTAELTSMTALVSMSVKEKSLLRSVGGFREAEVINARGDHRGIVGAGDRDLNGVCICGVVVVGDGDRVGQRDGFAGIEEVEGIGDGVDPVDGSRSLDIGA